MLLLNIKHICSSLFVNKNCSSSYALFIISAHHKEDILVESEVPFQWSLSNIACKFYFLLGPCHN